MTTLQTILLSSLGVAVILIVGCDLTLSERRRPEPVYVQQSPPPQYVAPQPQYVEPQPQYVVVQQAPPPLIYENRPPPPPGNVVWIDGYWNWDNQRYTWQVGRYAAPPQAGVVWMAPRYEYDARGGRYTPGQWSHQGGEPGRDPGRDAGRGR